MWNTTNLFSLVVAAMLFVLPACGDKGEAESEKKEAAKTEKKEAGKCKDHAERVVLSPESMKNASIKVITLNAESLADTIRSTANIAHNQDRSFHVTPRGAAES